MQAEQSSYRLPFRFCSVQRTTMALRQKRIIFVICPEPTDHGAGCSDAHAAFCIVLYFLSGFCSIVRETMLLSLRFHIIMILWRRKIYFLFVKLLNKSGVTQFHVKSLTINCFAKKCIKYIILSLLYSKRLTILIAHYLNTRMTTNVK